MNEKKLLNKETMCLLLGLCCLMCAPYGFGSAESDYGIVRFRCDEKGEKQVGDIVRLRVEIQNKGSADPGAVLTLFGLQEGANIGIENGVLIFDKPGKKPAKKEFAYSITSGGTIIWQATIDGDKALCTLCHGPAGPGKQFYEVNLVDLQLDGPTHYDLLCAACHKDLSNTELRGKPAEKIQDAINEDKGGMGVYSVLTWEQLQAIAAATAEFE